MSKNKLDVWSLVGVFGLVFMTTVFVYASKQGIKPVFSTQTTPSSTVQTDTEKLISEVIPDKAVLPIKWNDFGKQMTDAGVIDKEKFESLYQGALTEEQKQLLYGENNNAIVMTSENSGFLLNLFWAFGLANKNEILEKGPMMQGGSAFNFASTGGWTLAQGGAMKHYSKYNFIVLNQEQQQRVIDVSKGIYRPCCNNPTYFPDCNHGMAMLGLLELMAANNLSEREMYQVALKVNSFWFPDTYVTIAKYMKEKKNISWGKVDPKEVLGINFSSASGYRKVLSEVEPVPLGSGGSCGVR